MSVASFGLAPEGILHLRSDAQLELRSPQAPPAPAWPDGWGPRPRMRSHFGPSQIHTVDSSCATHSYGVSVWNQWVSFFERVPDIIGCMGVWPIPLTWDDIAGGAGSDPNVFSGMLTGVRPWFCTNFWPADKPLLIFVPSVPENSQFHNRNRQTGVWRNPSIWSEIKNGAYDWVFQRLFRRIARRCAVTGRDPKTLVLRFAAEMNGDWHPWSVGPDIQSFIDGWRRCIDIQRQQFELEFGASVTHPLIEFGPSQPIRFGSGSSQRMWNIYPGNDWVDIIGLGIHDQIGVQRQEDWDYLVRYRPGWEGMIDWFDWADTTGKWLGTSEICSNVSTYQWFPRTERNDIFWNGFEAIRRRYPNKWLYIIYLFIAGDRNRTTAPASQPWQPDGWGEIIRQMYKLNGLADQWGDSLPN